MSMDDRDRPSPIQSRAGSNRDERNRINSRMTPTTNKPLVTRAPRKEAAAAPPVTPQPSPPPPPLQPQEEAKPGIPMWVIVSGVVLALYFLFFR